MAENDSQTIPPVAPIAWKSDLQGEYPGQVSVFKLDRNGVCPALHLCWCPPSQLQQGFWLAKHPVSQAQWHAIMGENPSRKGKGDTCPVDSVSWHRCQMFCRKTGLRLPREAEWEYACRAGTTTPFALGSGESLNAQRANIDGNYPDGDDREAFKWLDRKRTLPTGSFPPNAWGLHDMHGQLWEWCEDTLKSDSVYRVLRGGSWISFGRYARSAFRFGTRPADDYNIGFRPCPSSNRAHVKLNQ